MKEIFNAILDHKKRFLLFKLLIVYLLVALPFKTLDILPGFANIRPVVALNPVFVFFFGPIGAWASGLGNLSYDIISNSLAWSSIAGFIANFSVPLIMYKLWHMLMKRSLVINSWHTLGMYTLVIIIGALLKVLIITPAIIFLYPEMQALDFAIAVLATDITFPLIPGIAIIIFMQNHYGFKDYQEKYR